MKKSWIRYFLALALAVLFWTCRQENEEITRDPDVKLAFSSDTIYFDTVFTTVGSVTRRLKVYNPAKHAVLIDYISLGNQEGSAYSLFVNGREGKSFSDELLLGGDSLLILVEVLVDPQDENLPFLVQDSIRFFTNNNLQDVKLVAWGQDAHFIGKSILACDTVWSPGRPVVLMDTVVVDSACSLTIEAGSRIYANQGAALLVAGKLEVRGTPAERVLFTSSRLDQKDALGQWGGIIFLRHSRNNIIDFATIRNGIYGIYIGSPDSDTIPDLAVSNTIIENAASAGLLCFTSDVVATNVLINSCGSITAAGLAGGNYIFRHCTFANLTAWINSGRSDPSTAFTNFYRQGETEIIEDLNVDVANSIVWGNLKNEILLNADEQAQFNLLITNSLLKTTTSDLGTNGNILNKDPEFINPEQYDYRLDSLSPAIDGGDARFGAPSDLDGRPRDNEPDMGAYERFEED